MIARNISFKERTIFGRTLFYNIVHLHYSYKRTKKLRVRGKQRTNIPLLLIINLNIVKLKDSKMKKVFTLCVAIMASVATFAQTNPLWDGEKCNLGDDGGFWKERCEQKVVINPLQKGINTSEKCLEFKITGNEWNTGSAAISLNSPSFESKRISLMIKKDNNSNVRIEIKCNNVIKKVAAWYDGNGAWQKLYFDFSTNGVEGNPTEITIFPTTDAVDGEQTIYLDNIQIEDAPKVNGAVLSTITDKNLEGVIKLSGTWMKGVCQNADVSKWKEVKYNDFTTLAFKISDNPTNIDMRGCIVKDADINAMRGDNSNILVYADEAYEADNVVKDGTCANLVLDDTKSFMVNEDFQATKVTLNRSVNAGNNTMCLPFWVNKEDMKAESIATFKEKAENKSVVTFVKVDHVEANVPFIANYNEAVTKFTFANKGVAKTEDLGTTFIGTYTPGYMEGKYGLTTDNTFKKGGAGAKTKAFRAYLELPEVSGAKTLSLDFTDGETTGIEDATISFGNKGVKVYSLQGNLIATASSMSELHLSNGIYIINNKKVIIK
jgi:hypothetical protein